MQITILHKSFQVVPYSRVRCKKTAASKIHASLSKMPAVQHDVDTPFKKATFGMGCFWACDALFGAQKGVLRTAVGYSGGTLIDPEYRKLGDHTEVIEIDYDPKTISFDDLLLLFWNNHEYGLTTCVKKQYMSLILYHDEDQKRMAEISLKKEAHKRNENLTTTILPAGKFYPAEDYHQKYRLQQHPSLVKELGITPENLKTSHLAARLNGYLAGVGKLEDLEKDCIELGLPEKTSTYVKAQWKQNEGGTLYC
ncbi:hypothetical protein WA026_016488 [Henosepilachna vigintioctopunctata]|uniref:peptide-methionine (S)-S-oxide reductase n=1 Tax=Henosepilachna vigintioctopunctata TaxID=420089 RepID=A0AAW1ULF2_9CUCU